MGHGRKNRTAYKLMSLTTDKKLKIFCKKKFFK